MNAEPQSHIKIGEDLKLFMWSNIAGKGFPIWLPSGVELLDKFKAFLREKYDREGYEWISSPPIADLELFRVSGHLEKYRDSMYIADGVAVKPMSCPFHIEAFKVNPLLPRKFAEFGSVCRAEQSGEVNGLLRSRAFTQDDGHIFIDKADALNEVAKMLDLYRDIYRELGFGGFRARIGVKPCDGDGPFDESIAAVAPFVFADALADRGIPFEIGDDAAFYGHKIDFLFEDRLGREWQLGTIQLDWVLPRRFGLAENVVIIHRAAVGSLERAIAILLEQGDGWLPEFLSPVKPRVLPVDEESLPSALAFAMENGFDLGDVRKHLNRQIRDAYRDRVPRIAVFGRREMEVPREQIEWRSLPN